MDAQIALTRFFDGDHPDPEAAEPVGSSSSVYSAPQNIRRRENLHHSFLNPHQPGLRRSNLLSAPRLRETVELPIIFTILFAPFRLVGYLVVSGLWLLGSLLPNIPQPDPHYFQRGQRLYLTNSIGESVLERPDDTAQRITQSFGEMHGELTGCTMRGYNNSLDMARREVKMLLVLLLSVDDRRNEHFNRRILSSERFKSFLSRNQDGIRIWIGNEADEEAYTLAAALRLSKLPAGVLISPTPRDDSSSLSMSIAAKISDPKDADSTISMLQRAIDRHSGPLQAIRSEKSTQDVSRSMRVEQETAYERSLAKDREKARLKKLAHEEAEQEKMWERERDRKEERKRRQREKWQRSTATKLQVKSGPKDKPMCKISIRMADGTRIVENFKPETSIQELYAYVDCYALVQEESEELEKSGDSETSADGEEADYQHVFDFRLITPLPRQVFDPGDVRSLSKVIGRSGNLIVESTSS